MCYRYASPEHLANRCKYKSTQCSKCKRIGHLAVVCRDGTVPRSQYAIDCAHFHDSKMSNEPCNATTEPEEVTYNNDVGGEYGMYSLDVFEQLSIATDLCLTSQDKKYIIPVSVNGHELEFELDTGAGAFSAQPSH